MHAIAVKNVEQQVNISGFPLIKFFHWDEQSNPFERAEAPVATASDSTALALNELFREQFSQLFLNGATSFSPEHAYGDQKKTTRAEARDIIRRWDLRLERLRALCPPSKERDKTEPLRFQLCEILAAHLPPTLPLEVWIHPRFQRMFTAVAEWPRLFCASLGPLDILDAARVAHECAHLRSGHAMGWRAFQQRPANELEEPAMRAEQQFLVDTIGPHSWAQAPLRLAWNEVSSAEHLQTLQQFADPQTPPPFASSLAPAPGQLIAESIVYLQLIEAADPL